jgi:hypothetical protein
MTEYLEQQAHRLWPFLARRVAKAARGAGNSNGGAIAHALMAAHLNTATNPDPHPQYRLKSVALDLADLADVTGVLPEANGGTNQSTYAAGDLLYASGADTLSKRAIGSANHLLTVAGGVPTWAALSNAMHGDLGGGTLHAAATAATAGFMSAADKSKLDGFGASTLTGSGTAKRLALWTAASILGDNAKLYTDVSPVGGAELTLFHRGEALIGGATALTSLYTGFPSETRAILEINSGIAGGAHSNYPALLFSADHSGYVGEGAITGAIVFADRSRTARYDAATINVIKDATYGARMIFSIASTTSGAPANALQILATGAGWWGYANVAFGDLGTLVGPGDFDIKGDLNVGGGALTLAGTTAERLAIWNASNVLASDDNLVWLASSGTFGVGSGTSFPSPAVTAHFRKDTTGDAVIRIQNATAGTGARSYLQLVGDAAGLVGYFGVGSSTHSTLASTFFMLTDSGATGGILMRPTAGVVRLEKTTALTNTAQEVLRINHTSSGSTAAGFGARILYQLEAVTTADQDAVALEARWNVATVAQRTSEFRVLVVTNAGALAEVARFDGGGGSSPAANNTGLMLWDVNSGTLKRVVVGAADSAGSGFRTLRIAN